LFAFQLQFQTFFDKEEDWILLLFEEKPESSWS